MTTPPPFLRQGDLVVLTTADGRTVDVQSYRESSLVIQACAQHHAPARIDEVT